MRFLALLMLLFSLLNATNINPYVECKCEVFDNIANCSVTKELDPDGQIVSYSWNLGEAIKTDKDIVYTYSHPGTYQVVLTVTDNDGGTGKCQQTISIAEKKPLVDFECEVENHGYGRNIQCKNSSSDPNGASLSYQWSVDGEIVSTSKDLIYTTKSYGEHDVTLIAKNSLGYESQKSKKVINIDPSNANINFISIKKGWGIYSSFTKKDTNLSQISTLIADDPKNFIVWAYKDGHWYTDSPLANNDTYRSYYNPSLELRGVDGFWIYHKSGKTIEVNQSKADGLTIPSLPEESNGQYYLGGSGWYLIGNPNEDVLKIAGILYQLKKSGVDGKIYRYNNGWLIYSTADMTRDTLGRYEGAWLYRDKGSSIYLDASINNQNQPPVLADINYTKIGHGLVYLFEAQYFDLDNRVIGYQWEIDGKKLDENGSSLLYTFDATGSHIVKLSYTLDDLSLYSVRKDMNIVDDSFNYKPKIKYFSCEQTTGKYVKCRFQIEAGNLEKVEIDYGDATTKTYYPGESGLGVYTHSYNEYGIYDITLTALDKNGYDSKKTTEVSLLATTQTESQCPSKLIKLAPSTIEVTGDEAKSIDIYTLTTDNRPVSTGLKIGFPMVNDTLFGEFSSYEVTTDDKGKATITFTPKNYERLVGNEYNVTIEELGCSDNNSTLQIKFVPNPYTPPTVQKLFIVPKSVSVVPNLKKEIDIYTLDNANRPIKADITLSFPEENGVIFGSFDKYNVTSDETGHAVVTYSAPRDLDNIEGEKNLTISSGTKSDILTLLFEKKSNTILYDIYPQIEKSIPLLSRDKLVLTLAKANDQDQVIADSAVKEVNVTSINKLLSFDEAHTIYEISYSSKAVKDISIYSSKQSGVDLLHIEAKIFDGDKDVVISKDVPVTIVSGPPASISLLYVGTSYSNGLFEETYRVHAVDRYDNPARAGSKIYVGAISGLRESNGKKLYITKGGNILKHTDMDTTLALGQSAISNGYDFSKVKVDDSVVVLSDPEHIDPLYLGGWIVDNVLDTHTLLLDKKYDGDPTTALTFAVGYEKRFDICENQPKSVDFDSADKKYEIGADGTTYVKLRYPPFFVGKTIFLYANSYEEKRVGVGIEELLFHTEVANDFLPKKIINTYTCSYSDKNCIFDIPFKMKTGEGIATLQSQKFALDNFTFSNDCNMSTAELIKNNTGCDGIVRLVVRKNAGADSCNVKWNETLLYEFR